MDTCNRNNAAKICPHGCCCHSYRRDRSQAMKVMPSVTVQAKRYRHTTMRACQRWQSLPITNKRVNHGTRLQATTKAHGLDGQFLAPTCMTALTACI